VNDADATVIGVVPPEIISVNGARVPTLLALALMLKELIVTDTEPAGVYGGRFAATNVVPVVSAP